MIEKIDENLFLFFVVYTTIRLEETWLKLLRTQIF